MTLAKDKEIAEAATPGPGERDICQSYRYVTKPFGHAICNVLALSKADSNAQYIAHFNPQTILALIDVVEKCLEFSGWYHDYYPDNDTRYSSEMIEAFEKLEKL